jgi:pyrimidine-nucleoside phosphorylase
MMAVFFQGMDDEETYYLTNAMAYSGDTANLSALGLAADKHSTGGVADTTTLIVVPLVASCGLKVAKMSGRGLGHTGGTLDKLESIPGMNIALTLDSFMSQVNSVGAAVMGQTMKLCPADKMLYSLRDVTATVESIPLIASSIMSKKIASGADIIMLDVKTGSGAFMGNFEDSKALAEKMVKAETMHSLYAGVYSGGDFVRKEFKTAQNGHSCMFLFKIVKLWIYSDKSVNTIENVSVGIALTGFRGIEGCDALLHGDMAG